MKSFLMKRLPLKVGMLFGLVILLTACTGITGNSGGSGNPSPTATATPSPTPTPSGISFGPQTCPVAVQSPAHWDPIIPTQPGTSQVQQVTCGYLKGEAVLQALITVVHSGTGSILDVYVYDNISSANPSQIFKLQDLYKGTARISGYNTVLTAEVDQDSSINKNKSDAGLADDLSREFKWSDAAGTLVQVPFSGIFPDLTRYEAEVDQAQVNQGNEPWKLNAAQTAQEFGQVLLKWNPNSPATVMSGGGQHDVGAVVKLKSLSPGNRTIQLSMTRLEDNTNGGIWIVTSAQSSDVSITSPANLSSITSPLRITGTGTAFEGVIGKVTILDHLDSPLGQATIKGAQGNGHMTFSASTSYKRTFEMGDEEGLVMVSEPDSADGSIGSVVFAKVLIG